MHADGQEDRTQKCHLWARPQGGQHLLRLWLFTDKENRGADEKRNHVLIYAFVQKRPHHLQNSTIRN